MVPVFKNAGERSLAKNYRPVSLLSAVSKIFEKLVNNRLVDHLENGGLFSNFQYSFRSPGSTADLLTVVLDVTPRALNRSGATRELEMRYLIYSRLSTERAMLVFFTTQILGSFRLGIWPYFVFPL